MNLCLACRDIGPDDHGGLARATRDLAVALAWDGHRVHVLTDSVIEATSELPGVTIVPLRAGRFRGRLADAQPESAAHNLIHAAAVYREVRRIHEADQPVDAVLAPLWRSEGSVCLLDDRFPTIVSCMTSLRTLTEIDPAYEQLPDISERLTLEQEALRRTRYLHGLTEAVLGKTISDHGLHPTLTAVIGRGLCDRATGSNSLGAENEAVEVLAVGRVERRKGVDTLIAAARELAAAGLRPHVTFAGPAGDRSFRDSLERQLDQPPHLNGMVRFAGPVPDPELYRLYRASDIVCAPSRYESHGIVLLEAMMFGKPLVTCNAGGITEVVEAEENALVCPPDDAQALAGALRRLVSDAELRRKLGQAARQTFERRFDARTVAGEMQSYIQEVVAAHGWPAHPGPVQPRLQQLLVSTLAISPSEAWGLAGDLLDPVRLELAQARAEIEQLRNTVEAQEATLEFLHARHETLTQIEQGGWWRLRGRLRPVLRIAARVRRGGRSA